MIIFAFIGDHICKETVIGEEKAKTTESKKVVSDI